MSLLTFLPVVLICAKSKNKKGKGWPGDNESPDQMVHSTLQQQGTQRERKKNQGELIDAIKKGVLIDPRNPDYATVQIKSTVFEFEEGGEKKKIKRDQL
ncbi:Glycoside hydrolase family 27 protein [Trichuris trichiura]|uniref:Glycoside hydrolase family 27 protein n=1 Tax=Trichuris trichiura TaxID=36087 RepID=A0A077ZFX2_TRITR|nr:Glycoside hydrolase family 27 protein [Trichuris trichiura]